MPITERSGSVSPSLSDVPLPPPPPSMLQEAARRVDEAAQHALAAPVPRRFVAPPPELSLESPEPSPPPYDESQFVKSPAPTKTPPAVPVGEGDSYDPLSPSSLPLPFGLPPLPPMPRMLTPDNESESDEEVPPPPREDSPPPPPPLLPADREDSPPPPPPSYEDLPAPTYHTTLPEPPLQYDDDRLYFPPKPGDSNNGYNSVNLAATRTRVPYSTFWTYVNGQLYYP